MGNDVDIKCDHKYITFIQFYTNKCIVFMLIEALSLLQRKYECWPRSELCAAHRALARQCEAAEAVSGPVASP